MLQCQERVDFYKRRGYSIGDGERQSSAAVQQTVSSCKRCRCGHEPGASAAAERAAASVKACCERPCAVPGLTNRGTAGANPRRAGPLQPTTRGTLFTGRNPGGTVERAYRRFIPWQQLRDEAAFFIPAASRRAEKQSKNGGNDNDQCGSERHCTAV